MGKIKGPYDMNDALLLRYMYGEATEEEKKQILDWLDSDPDKHVAEMNCVHFECTLAEVYGKPISARYRPLRRFARYAAAAAASVAVLVGVWQISDRHAYRKMSSQVARMETPAGQRVNIKLEDGTDVWLNAGTVLEYPPVFGRGVRRVRLSGEAMFDVRHDAQRPFVIETFSSTIEVLGTKFNILADENQNRFRTTLVAGSVKITNLLDPSQIIFMEPYDVVELVNRKLCKTRTPDFRDLCWTEGLIHIKKMPFDELMLRFEKAYNVQIVINRPALPEIVLQSGKIRISDGVDYALQVLQQVSDFTYRYDEEKNIIEIR